MTVVLVDPRHSSLVPVEAIDLLVGDLQYTEEMPIRVPWSLPAARPAYDGDDAPVLLSSDPNHPMVLARIAAGEKVISAPGAAAGERLLDAVAMMDKLRTSGPWEREQTHDSLRRYLLEETYELFDAVRGGDAESLRDELGDVLLQVLFHARIAEDSPSGAFNIDDVAESLIRKLINRAPAVLAGESISLEEQLAQWEERKAMESSVQTRSSSMDDVPTAQPALALAQKVIERVTAAGLPSDLLPEGLVSVTLSPGVDAENALRSTVLEFMDTIRKVEHSIAASRRPDDVPEVLDSTHLGTVTEEEWREHWPARQLPVDLVDDEPDPTEVVELHDESDPEGVAEKVAEDEPAVDEPVEQVVAEGEPAELPAELPAEEMAGDEPPAGERADDETVIVRAD
jgi:XTP/dITP diphosphohydrolase